MCLYFLTNLNSVETKLKSRLERQLYKSQSSPEVKELPFIEYQDAKNNFTTLKNKTRAHY